MYHYHYVNLHMPVTDPGTSEPGGVIEFLGSGDCFDTPSHALWFEVWEVSRMNILNIVFWLQLKCMQVLQLMQMGIGVGTIHCIRICLRIK